MDDLNSSIDNTRCLQLYIDNNLILRSCTLQAMKQFRLTPDHINKDIRGIDEITLYPSLVEHIEEVIETGNVLENEIQTSDDIWLQLNIFPYVFRNENNSNGVMITLFDITKQITTITQLQQVIAERFKGFNKLSHDLKQPISNIGLLAEELTEAYDKKDTEQFTTWIEILKNSSYKMNKLLDNFTKNL